MIETLFLKKGVIPSYSKTNVACNTIQYKPGMIKAERINVMH